MTNPTKIKHRNVAGLLILLLCAFAGSSQTPYTVQYVVVDSLNPQKTAALQTGFASAAAAVGYVAKLPVALQGQGFVTASVDSVTYDSLRAVVQLFLGEKYQWAKLYTAPENEALLEAARWNPAAFSGTGVDFAAVQAGQERLLNYLEEHGHPFAKIYLDSVTINGAEVAALLKIDRGPAYKIDSLRVYGDAKVDAAFLQRYLGVMNGSLYNKKTLTSVDRRLSELTYLQTEKPSNLTMLGTGSVLNLYLKAKKSSQINVLVGFLPNSDQASDKKFLLTGEANILLRNALNAGETIGLNWQQLQKSSPRLNLLYEHPFVFHSPFGLRFHFDMLRRDTTYLNLNMTAGANYMVSARQSATVFLQRRQSIVNGFNTAYVLQTRRLPTDADVSSLNLGVTYEYNATNYRFNPRKGTEASLTTSAGTKRLRKNNAVMELKDPANPTFKFGSLYDTVKLKSYQFRITGTAARYFPLGKGSTFKTALNGGVFSSGSIFRNELFQIGGYKLLRGFDEESLFVAQYAVGTLEYRYLIGTNSFFFVFADGAWTRNPIEQIKNHGYFGTGLGMAFETGAGIFNLAWAVGKRDDAGLNLRQSKVHLGFVNYF